MQILGIIPARGGSKGIPNKNIKLLNNKPLIAYTIESALASKLDRVVVSTDCQEIAGVSKEFGADVLMRPSYLAEDITPILPVLHDVVSKHDKKFEALMLLQPTSPLRRVEDINESIKMFKSDKYADSLVSVVEVPHNYMPEKLMSFDGKYLIANGKVKRRQEVPIMFARNGPAIYITKTEKLKNNLLFGKILPFFMSKLYSFDIDDQVDWDIIKRLI